MYKLLIPTLIALSLFVAVLTLAALGTTTADAQTSQCRPWCVHYGGGGTAGGGTNCGFTSYEQCMWTAQGGDICMVNQLCLPQGSRGSWQRPDDRRRR
jgi:hypothetical protein